MTQRVRFNSRNDTIAFPHVPRNSRLPERLRRWCVQCFRTQRVLKVLFSQTSCLRVTPSTVKDTQLHFASWGKPLGPLIDIHSIQLHHDNARSHTALFTTKAIAKMGWSVIPHPPYCPDLAPLDLYLFGPMKESLCGYAFEDLD